jgi:hypothetical protein
MGDSRLNIELFKAIREKIATTPAAYDQETWGRRDGSAPCGTACCIAGWACVLNGDVSIEDARALGWDGEIGADGISDGRHVSDVASEALGLSADDADTLFTSLPEGEREDYDDDGNDVFACGWPEPFATNWRLSSSDSERASVAVAYLDHIIETGSVLE